MEREGVRATDCVHGLIVGYTAFLILWYSIWTVSVNALVLIGSRFWVLPWCLLTSSLASLFIALTCFPSLLKQYDCIRVTDAPRVLDQLPRLFALLGLAIGGAILAHKTQSAFVLLITTVVTSSVACYLSQADFFQQSSKQQYPFDNLAKDFVILCGLLLALYYFGHRPDADDANYLNLAAKAPLTHGQVFEFDTMVGDGPHAIHLPTYRLQSYELLGAVLSSLSGLEPIAVFHLVLPAPLLVLFASVMTLVLRPVVGRMWLVAAVFAVAYLYVDTETYRSWGTNALIRFQQGKGPLVAIVPLLAGGLTLRWFDRQRYTDLIGLALLHICAIGLSANGLYMSPTSSGFVALAILLAQPRRQFVAALKLTATLIYPAVIAVITVIEHLGLPSEVLVSPSPYSSFRGVIGWQIEGIAFMMLLPLLPLIARTWPNRVAAAAYLPAIIITTSNPLGWKLISLATGNLGFRIFWCIPGAFIAGAVTLEIIQRMRLASARFVPTSLSFLALIAGIFYNNEVMPPPLRVSWHLPDLKVPRTEYDAAKELAQLTPQGCKALVPSQYATWISGLKHGPYLVAVSSLYLTHYRFSEPADELAERWALFDLVNGIQPNSDYSLTINRLKRYDMRVGLIGANPRDPYFPQVRQLAQSLGLRLSPSHSVPLTVWVGSCD
jgi:hypothetical protein